MKVKKFPALNDLKVRLRDKKITYRHLQKETGMHLAAINDKINGYSSFNPDEVAAIASIAGIPPSEITRYFFPQFYKDFYENAG